MAETSDHPKVNNNKNMVMGWLSKDRRDDRTHRYDYSKARDLSAVDGCWKVEQDRAMMESPGPGPTRPRTHYRP